MIFVENSNSKRLINLLLDIIILIKTSLEGRLVEKHKNIDQKNLHLFYDFNFFYNFTLKMYFYDFVEMEMFKK